MVVTAGHRQATSSAQAIWGFRQGEMGRPCRCFLDEAPVSCRVRHGLTFRCKSTDRDVQPLAAGSAVGWQIHSCRMQVIDAVQAACEGMYRGLSLRHVSWAESSSHTWG